MVRRDPRPVRPEAPEAGDAASGAGPEDDAVVAAETEAEEVTAEEQALTAAFGPVSRWWVGELPGLGVMRLPLP